MDFARLETQDRLWADNVRMHEMAAHSKPKDTFGKAVKAEVNSQRLAEFIDKYFSHMSAKELAASARISEETLSALKNKGFLEPTRSFRRLCHVLGIDADEFCNSKIVFTEGGKQSEHPLVLLAKSLIGTPHEDAAFTVLSSLKKTL